jgi:heme oxygenase
MSKNLALFRQGLKPAHAALEMEPAFRAVAGHDVTLPDIQRFMSILHHFYQVADQQLLQSPYALAGLYQPRAALLVADIQSFHDRDDGLLAATNFQMPAIQNQAQWLGIVYTIEGSAAGIRYLLRHLQHKFEAELSGCLLFFTTISANHDAHWPKVLNAFDETIITASALQDATNAAISVFNDRVWISKHINH